MKVKERDKFVSRTTMTKIDTKDQVEKNGYNLRLDFIS